MTMQASNPLEAFAWKPEYEAEKLVQGLVHEFLEKCPAAKDLARRMKEETGTRFGDWVDHIAMQSTPSAAAALEAAGFKRFTHPGNYHEWEHAGGMFPRIVLHLADEDDPAPMSLGIKVESVVDFLVEHGIRWAPSGAPLSPYRYAGVY